MFCSKCGKQIDDDAKFCEYCGAVINDQTVSSEKSEQSGITSKKVSVKKEINKPLIITIIAVVIVLIVGSAGIILFDNYNHKKGDDAIQSVKDSYFEFLPEMTVGDLLYEYYDMGENNWLYDSSEEQVEFWGTNKKDNSGLSVIFRQVDDNTVSTYSRMFHLEGEASHSITMEEFEEYILSLYAQLDENYQIDNKTTSTKAIQTTTIETVTTTTPKKQDKVEESINYAPYLFLLNEIDAEYKREFGDEYIPYYLYYLYDINQDGTYELLLHFGESEAEAVIQVYSIDENGGFIELGEIGGGHTWLTEKDGKLYSNFGHKGYYAVKELQMVGWHDVWSITEETVLEKDGLSDYESYGIPIVGYDISYKSAVEELCPKELLEDKPYADGYVETYALSGRDGSKIRLYLDGDFSSVSVQIQNQEYTSETEFYAKEDFGDYIEMNFNPFAQPPSVVYVTPYSDLGVAGDVITCDIPTDASGTIQTGGMSYPVDDMKGQINCHNGTVAGFTTDYVVNGGAAQKVRNSLGNAWHVTAKNKCDNYGVTWYELWDSDDGDYYGWVDSSYIDFY